MTGIPAGYILVGYLPDGKTPQYECARDAGNWPGCRDYSGTCHACHRLFMGTKAQIMTRTCFACRANAAPPAAPAPRAVPGGAAAQPKAGVEPSTGRVGVPLPTYDDNPDHPRTAAKLERPAGHEPLGALQAATQNPVRVHIRFESVRKRLLDPDNLSVKSLLDCLRYSGLIRGDEPDKITLETCQRKAKKGEAEHTKIEITTP